MSFHELLLKVVRPFEFPVLQAAFQHLAAAGCKFAFFCVQLLLDLGAGLGTDNIVEPVPVRPLVLGCKNLYCVAGCLWKTTA